MIVAMEAEKYDNNQDEEESEEEEPEEFKNDPNILLVDAKVKDGKAEVKVENEVKVDSSENLNMN